VSTSTREHRADEGATLRAVQVRGECSFGACRDSLLAQLGLELAQTVSHVVSHSSYTIFEPQPKKARYTAPANPSLFCCVFSLFCCI